MNTRSKARFVSGALLGTVFCVTAGTAGAQVGHVVSAQKISDTSGGFTATLDEEDQFGRSIVNLGDLDGDGVTDLMVGAHTDDDGGLDQGSLYILFMRSNGFVKAWQKISDLEGNFAGWLDPGDQFGRAAANIGDLDGDGVVDVAVSANYDDDGGANKGAVYILFLRTDGTVKAAQKISSLTGGLNAGLRIHDEFGRSITALGDLNGDGLADIVVGTPEDDEGGTNTGALHVLFLNANGTVKNYRRLSKFSSGLAIKPGDWFGFCTTNLGDFDGDGVTDIATGAVLDDDGGVNQGSIWILCLNADGSLKSSREIHEGSPGFDAQLDDIDQFGTSVANIGDLDGNGVTDVAVGTVKDDDGGMPGNVDADVGAVYVLFLESDATVKSWVKISDTSGDLPYSLDQYDWFGSALARLGGSPGDGLFNLAIGCRNDDDGSPNRGSIYLVQLNDGTAPAANFTADRTLGVAPMTVSFTDASSGEVTAWVWSFSEGNQSSQRNPSRTFTAPGTYDIQLTAKGPRGKDVEMKRAFITVVSGPLADFSATPTTGVAPLSVQFADLSEGAVTSWWWEFGDGASSAARNPAHVFPVGTWTVSLTVTGPAGTDTRTRTALVEAQDVLPQAQFTADARDGFAPHAVQFADQSTGAVTGWSWSFGDGATSNEVNPLHVYTTPGSYTVSLEVTGVLGGDVLTRTDWITVVGSAPVAEFDAAPRAGTAPLAVAFSDLSSGNVTGHLWSFGDGASSLESDPTHVYDAAGTFTVSLTVSGPDGSDVAIRSDLITVAEPPPLAEFLTTSTIGFAPFTTQFTDQSSGIVTSRTWDFGDGESSSEEIVEHTFVAAGLYSVSLTVASPYGSSTELKSALVRVEEPAPIADFRAPLTSGLAPLAVQFNDTSSGLVTAWEWSFGDGSTSHERNPEHVYHLPATYDVTLRVSGPAGDHEVTRASFVTAFAPAPTADFAVGASTGFAPLAVQFEDRSAGPISTYSWAFGDGASSSEASPAHTYSAAGTYDVTLIVSGPGGVDDEQRSALITVLDPTPHAQFSAGATSGAAPLEVQFADASSGWVTGWSWSFGDGTTSTEPSPRHDYVTPGTYAVRLTASGPAGSDVVLKNGFVTVQSAAPVPEFSAGPVTGFVPLPVAFTDLSTGNATSWTWSFGDGTSARKRHPLKVYTRPGVYTVTLTVKGPGGTRTLTRAGIITAAALPQFPDGGFEAQTADAGPGVPWSVSHQLGTRIRSIADGGFPREGIRWLELDASASVAATPPSNPGAAGTAPTGTVGVTRVFAFHPLAPHLEFDAAFVLGDAPSSQGANDFLSVDVSDGTTTWNVHYADSFSTLSGTSARLGLPMTAVQRVRVDLRTLFPGLAAGAQLTLRAGVGNGSDGANPSYAFLDGFRLLTAATATFRNGTGRNAARYVSSPATLGGGWTIQVDTTGHTGARLIQLGGYQRPASGVLRPTGEMLCAAQRLFSQSWPAKPGVNVLTITLPTDSSLLGQYMATQVTITGGRAELTNAYDLVVGY